MIKDAFSALTLITKLPLGFACKELKSRPGAVKHFPLAGYLSFLLWFAAYKASFYASGDKVVSACLSLAAVYFFFNLFHFDGFLDSIDGLLSQKSREEALKIMKLGNIGPTALFFGVIYLLMKVYLAVKINIIVLLPVFVLSRWGMSLSAWLSKPASENGLGNLIVFGNTRYLAYSALYIPALLLFEKPHVIAIMLGLVVFVDLLLVSRIEHRIGGMTGDNFGLINEINELLLMLTAFCLHI